MKSSMINAATMLLIFFYLLQVAAGISNIFAKDSSAAAGTFAFYDELRTRGNTVWSPIYTDGSSSSYIGRNLHRVRNENNDPIDGHESLTLCHVPSFLRYSNNFGPACTVAYAASAGAMLAMHHFNTGNGIVVPELDNIHETCSIRLTTEIVDTESSPILAVKKLTSMLSRNSNSVSPPQPCAVFGSQISSVTSKLATLTGVFDLFQVSSSAMSTEFDNDIQYPLLARSHTDVRGFGEMSISYLKENLGVKMFALLVPNDSYGLSFQKSVLDSANKYRMEYVTASYSPSITSEREFRRQMRDELRKLERSGYNYFISAFYPELIPIIMEEAYEMKIAGPGQFWLISGTADTAPYIMSGKLKVTKDSPAAKAIAGSGLIVCRGGLPGVGSYTKFTQEWAKIGQDADALEYINSKQPSPPEGAPNCSKSSGYFENLPHHIVTFSYDAIVSLGMSACNALKSKSGSARVSGDDFFTGKEHRDAFAENEFVGASGKVILRDDFPTRTSDSSSFIMYNLQATKSNSTHTAFDKSPLAVYYDTVTSVWEIWKDNIFVYSDGGKKPPKQRRPPPKHKKKGDDDHIDLATWVIVVITVAVVLIVSVSVYLYVSYKNRQADSIWTVKKSELTFDSPPEIIGRGTFGLVLKAHYRGTQVAVKRVIPAKKATDFGVKSYTSFDSRSSQIDDNLDVFLDQGEESGERSSFFSFRLSHRNQGSAVQQDKQEDGQIGTQSGSLQLKKMKGVFCSGRLSSDDERNTLRRDFIREMRILAKLRHPMITTVMGAVLDYLHEPMLVMEYMDHGSLHDILHNKTMLLEGDLILPILKDISQGLRFLHAANPQIIHSDLKSANVLVDNRFTAKVADFGLSQKKKMGASGTPYWMSPELLRGESENTSASDVYSFGIILFEVYSRQNPYEGEDFKEVVKGVIDPKINKRPPTPSSCPAEIKILMHDCLVGNPENRPGFKEIDERLNRLDAKIINPRDIKRSMQEKKERRTNELLFDVFPQPIAEALRDGRKVEPTTREVVTIFFSDIVGFTDICSSLPPIKVSQMLDRLYNAFDNLSRKHEIFKVETIGDAYMAVTNLVKDQEDHAKRIADFAIDAVEAANITLIDASDKSKGHVQIRVGFHSGPVVANVVGSRNPRYCLFGDTVNTASRMESNSQPGKIHCSDQAAHFLSQQSPTLPILARGWIHVKGKGDMKTWWVNETKIDNN